MKQKLYPDSRILVQAMDYGLWTFYKCKYAISGTFRIRWSRVAHFLFSNKKFQLGNFINKMILDIIGTRLINIET